MALFSFGKKKEETPQPADAPPTSVVDQIIGLQQQGYSNNQIIQALQRAGYTPAEISDAMNQVSVMQGVEPYKPEPMPAPAPQTSQPSGEDTEQLIEKIVQEKLDEFRKEMAKSQEWRDKTDSRLDKLEQAAEDLKNDLDGLHKAIVAKIGEYDKNLVDVGTEIKAMEKVFTKVLPTLNENIQELSKATKTVKAKK